MMSKDVKQEPGEKQEWFTPAEAAEYLRVSRQSIYNYMEDGSLPYYKLKSGGRKTDTPLGFRCAFKTTFKRLSRPLHCFLYLSGARFRTLIFRVFSISTTFLLKLNYVVKKNVYSLL